MQNCYRTGGCGPYEMLSCSECPASKPSYAQRGAAGAAPVQPAQEASMFVKVGETSRSNHVSYVLEIYEGGGYKVRVFTHDNGYRGIVVEPVEKELPQVFVEETADCYTAKVCLPSVKHNALSAADTGKYVEKLLKAKAAAEAIQKEFIDIKRRAEA